MDPTPEIRPITSTQIIHDDILMEILLRLPAKPLIRLKLVSKRWLYLISSHQFSRLHTLLHPKSQPGLLLSTSLSEQQHFLYFHPNKNLIPLHFPSFLTGPKILSSSNGLILLHCDHHHGQKDYFVYNPTTSQSRNISLTNSPGSLLSLSLAFDPSISPYYKIICVKETNQETIYTRCCQILIYDSENHIWKLCLESFTVSVHVFFPHSVHLKNVVYWGNCPHASLYYDIGKNEIGSLPDFEIPYPPPVGRVRGGALYARVQEYNGHLYRPVNISGREKSIAVFELEEDHSQWLLKYHNVIDSSLHQHHDILSFLEKDEEGTTIGILLFQSPEKIVAYKFLDKSYEKMVDFRKEGIHSAKDDHRSRHTPFGYSDVYHFCASLAPV